MTITYDSLPGTYWQEPHGFGQLGPAPLVYRVHLPASQAVAAQAPHLLLPSELQRAERYLRAADRQRFLVARAVLRLVLGGYTSRAPSQVRFAAGPNQKPLLPDSPHLHFSVSHSQDWILLALHHRELGVDVEEMAPGLDFLDALRDNFRPAEAEHIWQSPDSRRLFFRSWTRKEAYVKATAAGIDEQFASLPSLDGRYQLPGAAGPAWRVSSFDVAADYCAALAFQPDAAAPPAFINLSASYLEQQLLPAVLM